MYYLTVAMMVCGALFSPLNVYASGVMDVTAEDYSSEVEQYKGNVILDVYADWCQPCKKMKPIFEGLSSEYTDIKFLKMDSDKAKDIVKQLKVTGLPTFLFFKDGKLVGRQVGYTDAEGIKAKIKELF